MGTTASSKNHVNREDMRTSGRRPKTLVNREDKRISARSKTRINSLDFCTNDVDVDYIVSRLTPPEMDIAAKCDYQYFEAPQDELRREYAKQMALRYLRSVKDKELALKKLKATLECRRDLDVDGLRKAFSDPNSEDALPLSKLLSNKHLFVEGYDVEGHSTIHYLTSRAVSHDPEWSVKAYVWTMEKAIACSKSQDKTVNVIFDFHGFSARKNAPPFHVIKQLMKTIRSHYRGRVHAIYVLEAPWAVIGLWNILKPIVGKATRDKIFFLNSDKEKESVFRDVYKVDQATPWVLPNGELTRELDLQAYLYETPFDRCFDE